MALEQAIAIVGTGRVAQALGASLRRRGLLVAAIAGRRHQQALEAARFIGGVNVLPIADLARSASHVLIAVSDDAIPDIAQVLSASGLASAIVLHTSGSAGPDALDCLRPSGNSVGVIHPLQTIPTAAHGLAALAGAAYACAGDAPALEWAHSLVERLGGTVLDIHPGRWQRYHAAAVIACNYHVALIDAALELMEGAGVARDAALHALAPMVRATTANVLGWGPEAALTGPIRRGDLGSVQRHLAALPPEMGELYAVLGLRTVGLALRSGLPAAAATGIETALEDSLK